MNSLTLTYDKNSDGNLDIRVEQKGVNLGDLVSLSSFVMFLATEEFNKMSGGQFSIQELYQFVYEDSLKSRERHKLMMEKKK